MASKQPKEIHDPNAPFGAFFAYLQKQSFQDGWTLTVSENDRTLTFVRQGEGPVRFLVQTGEAPALVNRDDFRLFVSEDTPVTKDVLALAEELGTLYDRYQVSQLHSELGRDGASADGLPWMLVPMMGLGLWLLAVVGLALLRQRQHQRHAWRSAFFDLLLALTVLVLFTGLSEFALSVVDYNPLRRDDLHLKNGYYHLVAKERSDRIIPKHQAELRTEEVKGESFWLFTGKGFHRFGGRGPEPKKTKPSLRLAFIGNSIVFGSGVEDRDSFVRLLETRFRSSPGFAEDTEVVNLAVPGYDLPRYKIALQRYLKTLKPDLLVLGLWRGDMVNVVLRDGVLYRADVHEINGVHLVGDLPFNQEETAWLAQRSRLAQLVITALGNAKVWVDSKPVSQATKMLRDLEEIQTLADEQGTKTMYLWFPPLDVPFSETLQHHHEPEGKGSSFLYHRVQTWAKEHGILLLDVAMLLQEESVEALRLDPCCHYNEQGHRRLTEMLWPRLLERLSSLPGNQDDSIHP